MKEESHPPGSGWLVETEDNFDTEAIAETSVLCKTDRDRPLSFHWRGDVDFTRLVPALWTIDSHQNVALNSILTEAVLAAEAGQCVSYSRAKGFYTGLRRYHGTAYTYQTVLVAIESALEHGLIEEDRAPPGRRGWQSRFAATPLLLDLWYGATAVFHRPELIYLRNADGDLIDYPDTDPVRRMRRDLQGINEHLRTIRFDINAPDAKRSAHHLELDGAFYLPTPPELYRVFNRGSWSKGGRAYGWWQYLPKARRAASLIDGEAVQEPDFDAMHAAILYARLGKTLDFKPYETGDYPRQHGKLAFVIGINARSHVGAINSLAKKLDCDKGYAAAVYAAMRRRNKDLDDAGAFGSDKGAGLMRQDSEITIGAMKALARAGIPALPVHDSIITPARHADHVAGEMRESFAREFNGAIHCTVRVSEERVLHMPFPPPLPSLPTSSASPPAPEHAGLVQIVASSEDPLCSDDLNVIRERAENLALLENQRPVQLSFVDLLDEGPTPELAAIAELFTFEGGIIPRPIISMIRDSRRRRGERQEDMARAIGISRPQLANAERQRFGLGREPAARLRQWVTGNTMAA